MKCQTLFSRKNEKIIVDLSSAELARSVIKEQETICVKCQTLFSRKKKLRKLLSICCLLN